MGMGMGMGTGTGTGMGTGMSMGWERVERLQGRMQRQPYRLGTPQCQAQRR